MPQKNIPIVYIHIGETLPSYARLSAEQSRLWNPANPIYFIVSNPPEKGFDVSETWVSIESFPKTPVHEHFCHVSKLNTSFRNGFWKYTTERLFTLYDWMLHSGIHECFHMEYDNMLYFSLNDYPFHRYPQPLLAPMLCKSDRYCHVGFSVSYFRDANAMEQLLNHLACPYNIHEMEMAGAFWAENPELCGTLPVCPPGTVLVTEHGRRDMETTHEIFDVQPYGQYLGGQDPRNDGQQGPGYENIDCSFTTAQFKYKVEVDTLGRGYPLLIDKTGKSWPIYNLHVHCKDLAKFRS